MSQPLPWYRQFWPWFLFGLPASAVVAGIVTLVIALQNSPDLVVDDYYRVGKTVNRDLAQDRLASALGVQAELSFEPVLGVVISGLEASPVERVQLSFRHNLVAERDQAVWLESANGSDYSSSQPVDLTAGQWYVQLQPEGQGWRLRGRLEWPLVEGQALRLSGD